MRIEDIENKSTSPYYNYVYDHLKHLGADEAFPISVLVGGLYETFKTNFKKGKDPYAWMYLNDALRRDKRLIAEFKKYKRPNSELASYIVRSNFMPREYTIAPTFEEINETLNKAAEFIDEGKTQVPGMTYEQGVQNGIAWIIGNDKTNPLEP